METSEIIAWLFIVLSFVTYIFRDKNVLCNALWSIFRAFWVALAIVLTFVFVKDQLTKK
jgi:hypothetical protein